MQRSRVTGATRHGTQPGDTELSEMLSLAPQDQVLTPALVHHRVLKAKQTNSHLQIMLRSPLIDRFLLMPTSGRGSPSSRFLKEGVLKGKVRGRRLRLLVEWDRVQGVHGDADLHSPAGLFQTSDRKWQCRGPGPEHLLLLLNKSNPPTLAASVPHTGNLLPQCSLIKLCVRCWAESHVRKSPNNLLPREEMKSNGKQI